MRNTKNDNLRLFTNRGLAIGSIPLTLLVMVGLLFIYYMGGGGLEGVISCGVLAIGWVIGCMLCCAQMVCQH